MPIQAETLEAHVKVTGIEKAKRDLNSLNDTTDGIGTSFESTGRKADASAKRVDDAGSRMQAAMGGVTTKAKAQATETARAASSTNRLGKEAQTTAGSLGGAGGGLDRTRTKADGTGKSIDKLSGRLRIFADIAAILGPGLAPIAAVTVPAVTALAGALGFAAVGGGVLVGSMVGVADALKAVNKADLEPTAANLDAARLAMAKLSPEARGFVRELQSLGGPLTHLRDLGATNMLPGFTRGLQALKGDLPEVGRIAVAVGGEIGTIGERTGKSLASERWKPFLRFIAAQAPRALDSMASTAGNLGHTMAEVWMAFNPTNQGALDGLEKMTARLDAAAGRMSSSAGFQEFLNYITTNGPKVGALIAQWANALLQVGEAAAPLGGVVLSALTAIGKIVGAVANSDLGTPIMAGVAALAIYNRTMAVTASLQGRTYSGGALANMKAQATSLRSLTAQAKAYRAVQSFKGGGTYYGGPAVLAQANKFKATLKSTAATAGKASLMVAGLALVTSGLGDKMGITNTASMAMMGMMAGPWGAAIGAGVGAVMDLAHANDTLKASTLSAQAAMNTGNVDSMRAQYKALSAQIKDTTDVSFWNPGDADAGLKKIIGSITGVTSKAKEMKAALADRMAGRDMLGLGGAIRSAAAAAAQGATAAKNQAAALLASRNAARETANGFVSVANAASAAKGSVGAFIRTLQAQARDLIAFGNNATIAANRGLRGGLIKQLQALGPAGASLMRKFANGTQANINAANRAFDSGKKAVKGYTDATAHVPVARGTKFTAVGAEQAKAQIGLMRAEIARLKDKSVHLDEKGSAAARARIAALRAAIASLHDRQIQITTVQNEVRSGKISARGNLFRYAQGGGYGGDVANRHQAVLAGPGDTRVWREPETGGEAYIPLKNDDRRPRARSILEQTASILGGQVAWYARGGTKGGGKGKSKGPSAATVQGNNYVKNLAEAIKEGSVWGITKAADVMQKRMSGAAERGWDSKFKPVLAAAKNLAAVSAKLATATAKRDALVEAKASAKDAITQGIASQANVLNAGNNVGTIKDSLATQLAKAKEFAANLQALRKMGFSNAVLEQVGSAGIEGGAEVAKALMAGTSADVASINASFKGITDVAGQTGAQLAGQMYDAGIKAANGIVAGLTSQQKAIEAYMTKIAVGMEKALKKALKIKSPSQVTASIGSYVGLGLIRGMERQHKPALEASRGLARAAIMGLADLGPAGGAGAPQVGTRGLTPASLGVAPGQGNLHLEFKTYNPVAEPQSRTTNKALDRAASLGLVGV